MKPTLDQPKNGYSKLFLHTRIIPFGHGDMAGIVYTPRFSDYCMEATGAWLQEVIDLDWYQINKTGIYSTPTLNLTMDFISPLYPNDQLNIAIEVERIGNSSFCLRLHGFKYKDASIINIFKSYITLGFVDMKEVKSLDIPCDIRNRMLEYQNVDAD